MSQNYYRQKKYRKLKKLQINECVKSVEKNDNIKINNETFNIENTPIEYSY